MLLVELGGSGGGVGSGASSGGLGSTAASDEKDHSSKWGDFPLFKDNRLVAVRILKLEKFFFLGDSEHFC